VEKFGDRPYEISAGTSWGQAEQVGIVRVMRTETINDASTQMANLPWVKHEPMERMGNRRSNESKPDSVFVPDRDS
jgi:hypothetical protein